MTTWVFRPPVLAHPANETPMQRWAATAAADGDTNADDVVSPSQSKDCAVAT
ncbi:hypothetical protein FRC08_009308 [Ceratobasidium sp. 394]|nr:hypothetical protein FRC08_009308 [Ceratobasidium sp. 394]